MWSSLTGSSFTKVRAECLKSLEIKVLSNFALQDQEISRQIVSDRNDFFGFGRTETETEIRPPKPGRTETEIKLFEFDNNYSNFHSIFPHFHPHSKVKVQFHQITHRNQVFLIEIVISLNWTKIHSMHSFDTGVVQYLHTFPTIQSLLHF